MRIIHMATQICVMAGFFEVPTHFSICIFYLIHLQRNSICQRDLAAVGFMNNAGQ